jgi:hypothetical protein
MGMKRPISMEINCNAEGAARRRREKGEEDRK